MSKKEKRAPFYLLVHTNSYTGNFERELVAYCIGRLDEVQRNHSREYQKAFWNSVAASDIDSYEEYMECELREECNKATDLLASLEAISKHLESKNVNIEEMLRKREERIAKERYDKDICRLYDTYLCETYQTVDDWQQDIFYNIESFYKNKEYNCDTIYIQLNKPLPEHFEKIVIGRIKQFFEQDAYNLIEDYSWLCQFGHRSPRHEDLQLLDLELVDQDYNLVKKYV